MFSFTIFILKATSCICMYYLYMRFCRANRGKLFRFSFPCNFITVPYRDSGRLLYSWIKSKQQLRKKARNRLFALVLCSTFLKQGCKAQRQGKNRSFYNYSAVSKSELYFLIIKSCSLHVLRLFCLECSFYLFYFSTFHSHLKLGKMKVHLLSAYFYWVGKVSGMDKEYEMQKRKQLSKDYCGKYKFSVH